MKVHLGLGQEAIGRLWPPGLKDGNWPIDFCSVTFDLPVFACF
jgi:hypothetical protein